jgi:hypothetical protein
MRMSMTASEAGAELAHARWKNATPEQRRAHTQPARIALAIKTLVDQAPALSTEQRNKLRVILTQAPSGGEHDAGP